MAAGVTAAAFTSHCYDYLDVSVLDADGRQTCAATVTATNGGDRFELSSCYYAPLTDGRWTLRASLSGYSDALTTVLVEHPHDCTRYVQSVELTLKRVGTQLSPMPALGSPLPVPTAPAAPTVSVPTLAPPTSEPAPLAPATTDSAATPNVSPTKDSAPPRGVFPDH